MRDSNRSDPSIPQHVAKRGRAARLPVAVLPSAGPRRPEPTPDTLPLFADEEWSRLAAVLRLSPRERQVVQGIFAGHSEDVLAAALGISVHTVHCHVGRLYRKLAVGSRADLLVRVFRAHLTLTRTPA